MYKIKIYDTTFYICFDIIFHKIEICKVKEIYIAARDTKHINLQYINTKLITFNYNFFSSSSSIDPNDENHMCHHQSFI